MCGAVRRIPGQSVDMAEPLPGLARRPVVVAPMAGGPSTTGLVTAASGAGALAFLAAGYKTAAAMRSEMDAVRAAGMPFGVNVFVPGAPAADRAALTRYLAELEPDAAALGVRPGSPDWDDDDWDAKLAALLADPPAVASFTFGCPDEGVIAALRAAGSQVWVTVTAPGDGGGRRCWRAGRGRAVRPGPRGGGAPRHAFSDDRRDGPPYRAAAPPAPRCRGGHRAPADRRGRDHEPPGRQGRAGRGRGGGSVRHRVPALPGERCPAVAQGGPRGSGVHCHGGHPRVHRQARARPGQPLHARPPGRAAGLPRGALRHPAAARRRRGRG